jgi:hypothetical protein
VPQLLLMLVSAAEHGAALPASLRFIAVGGGRVAPALLQRAERSDCRFTRATGCPNAPRWSASTRPASGGSAASAGRCRMSRCASVRPARYWCADRACSAIWVSGAGRTNGWTPATSATSKDGFLVLHGRSKHQFITAYGRNVNPEWVESELVQQAPIAQAWLHGEALPANVAVLVPRRDGLPDGALQAAVDAVNAELPDYARVHHWLRADAAFTPANGLATANGRLRPRRCWRATATPSNGNHHRNPVRRILMQFYESLLEQTADERAHLLSAPIIQQALDGTVTLESYVAFLGQAYHHVKHTVPC